MTAHADDDIVRSALRSGRRIFALALAFSFLCNLLRLTGPLFILLVYDRVLSSGSTETLVVLFSLVVAFLITMGMVDYARRRLLARFGAQFQERIEEELFRTSPKEDFLKTNQVKPIAGLSDIDAIRGFFHSSAIIAVLDVIWAPIFLAVVFVFHWVLGCVVLGGIAILAALYSVKTGFSAAQAEQAKRTSNSIGELKNLIISSKPVLKSQAMVSSFNERWLLARQASRDSSISLKDRTTWFAIVSRQFRSLLQYTVLAVGAFLTLGGYTTPGIMFTSMFMSVRVFVPVERFFIELPGIKRVLSNWQFLKKHFSGRKNGVEHKELWDLEPSLALSNVATRSAATRQLILRSVNLTAQPGEKIEITGPSGCGKTVLAETILGMLPKAAGTISVGGASIDRLSLNQAEKIVAYVPESVELINGTIEENICGMATAPDVDKMFRAAKLARVHELMLTLPDGYQTRIKPGYDGLSRGQRCQIAFARALYRQPGILIIDEPDTVLQEILADVIANTSVLSDTITIVLSRVPLADFQPDQQYLLDDGRLKVNKSARNVVSLENPDRPRRSKNRAGD